MKNPDKLNRKDISNLCKLALDKGGDLVPLKIPSSESLGEGLTNGSILFHKDKWLLNLRRVGYLFYQSENKQKFPCPWGPLVYLNPENDVVLRTTNYICDLNSDTLEVDKWRKTDTTLLDRPPLWEFIGLEDARLQFWDNKLYQTGVRRDTTVNGQGRMELSTIKNDESCMEIDRVRIEPPSDPTSYCEKNWMAINDMPYHYIKWSSPTELVKVDPNKGTSELVKIVDQPHIKTKRDMRGSSNIIKYKDYWVGIIHEVDLWFNSESQKDSIYYHRFVVWDKDWKIKYISDEFDFMTGRVEFTCGIGFDEKTNNFLIPFGFQDHTSFMLSLPESVFREVTNMEPIETKKSVKKTTKHKTLHNFIHNPFDANAAFKLGEGYFKEGHWGSALGFFLRAAEYTDDLDLQYESFFMVCRCLANKGGRDECEQKMWLQLISLDPTRPEGYAAMASYYSWRGNYHNAYFYSNLGYTLGKECKPMIKSTGAIIDKSPLLKQTKLFGSSYGLIKDKLEILKDFISNPKNHNPALHAFMAQEAAKYKLVQ